MTIEKFPQALSRFKRTLQRKNSGGTTVYEVKSHLLKNIEDTKKTLNGVPNNCVIWQHTPVVHIVAIELARGTGLDYSRNFFELIKEGIETSEDFTKLWFDYNGNFEEGIVPSVDNPSFMQSNRKKLKSLIVADTKHQRESRYITGSLEENTVDRTHLIPFTATGIENNPGIMIDFDSWLNRNPMEEFETKVLKYNRNHDITWITVVYGNDSGLNLEYLIFKPGTNHIITRAHWVDDRRDYYWFTTKEQQKLYESESNI